MLKKWTFFFMCFRFGIVASAQQLPLGTFAFSTGYCYREIMIKEGQKFEYQNFCCTGGESGSGTYSLQNKDLFLRFENPQGIPLPLRPSIRRETPKSEIAELSFTFSDLNDSSTVSGITILGRSKRSNQKYVLKSNKQGLVKLKMEPTDFPVIFEILSGGVGPNPIRLDTIGDYAISIPLNFDFFKPYIKGESLHFIVGDFDAEKLVLQLLGEEPEAFETLSKNKE